MTYAIMLNSPALNVFFDARSFAVFLQSTLHGACLYISFVQKPFVFYVCIAVHARARLFKQFLSRLILGVQTCPDLAHSILAAAADQRMQKGCRGALAPMPGVHLDNIEINHLPAGLHVRERVRAQQPDRLRAHQRKVEIASTKALASSSSEASSVPLKS